LTVATGIVNVWMHDPAALAAEHAALTREFPDRLLLGIGIGHPEAIGEYATPLASMGTFLDGLDGAATPVPPGERAIAALGPKMLDLCAERTRGTLTYFCPVAHTRFARERVGPQTLIATELACVLDTDAGRARESARAFATLYLARTNYVRNLLRFGFSEADVADGGSDRLIDAIVPHGTAEQVAAVAREHLDAGADQVCVQPVGVSGIPREEWSALAAALIG
jgi:probable F420-dependent oxidoreductase